MSQHKYHKCRDCNKPGNCRYCDGGLLYCVVCGGAESELLKHCPGRRLNEEALSAISMGKIQSLDWFRHKSVSK